jgi:hypothetical protein
MLTIAKPAEAACHRFKVWHYNFPQRCFTAYAPPARNEQPLIRTRIVPPERIEIIIPPLEWVPCPIGDEYMQGIAKLKGLM